MFCKNCGNEIKENSSFCDKCGNPISDTKTNKKFFNKKVLIFFICVIILIICICIIPDFVRSFNIGYKQSHYISTIKNGVFLENRDVTVGTMLEAILTDIKWETIVAADNNYYVNVSGNLNNNNVLIQFKILQDDHWDVNAFEMNGKAQPVYNIHNEMYDLYLKTIE
ncbi:zinc ribbon domain-containing protein [Brachyspira aalborgi]|nr:zinc ribbon domain-containing protein [Brachyspira aalborgi]